MCDNCPRKCEIDRNVKYGYCKMPYGLNVAKIMMHKWEEPYISGIEYGFKGTCAIFFYGCNLSCIYCQNYKISNNYKYENIGKNFICYSKEELTKIMLDYQKNGAYSISFISPTIYIDDIIECIKYAKENGVNRPFVYNTSGYDNVDKIKKLDGLIDIYLPDFKYIDDDLGKKYSDVLDYVNVVKCVIEEMYIQIKNKQKHLVDKNSKFYPKLIVRHLVMPSHIENSKKIIKYLYDKYKDDIYLSIMNQYTPTKNLELYMNNKNLNYDNLLRNVTIKEYDRVVDFAISLGIENAFIQEKGTSNESFIPDFQ